ncbi:MAG: Type 1 glutamine amidotransferase-like domain-containing protein [Candidatus Nanopelagicales bacterium]
MHLYLSSFRLGTAPQHLVRLAGDGAHVAVIDNAIDGEPEDVRRQKVADEVHALERLGLQSAELDLRHYFGTDPHLILNELTLFDAVWVRGGNVFLLRCALAESGADNAIRALLADDRLVYAGYSAGPCVLAPSLEGLEDVDDAAAPLDTYGVPALMTGLGVLDRRVVPHVDSPAHPEAAAMDELSRRYEAAGVPHLRLRDGQALIMDGDHSMLVGRPAEVAELLYEPR